MVIEVDIQIAVAGENKRVWYPKKLQRQDILVDLYQDASSITSDVAFIVGKMEYQAHTNILSLRCKKLYEIVIECGGDGTISIDCTKEEIFKKILDFAYTVKTPEIENENIATELLVAADRYYCVDLKLYVESIIVDKFLTAGNAAEMLLFADSHSCALLKEAATNLFVTDAKNVKKSEAWSQIKESNRLLAELLDCVTSCNEIVGENFLNTIDDADDSDEVKEIDWLDVTTLREKLEEANLELDVFFL